MRTSFTVIAALFSTVQSHKLTSLPLCDGSNGVVGVNCAHPGGYPRKVTGTPYAPSGPPVLALAEGLPLCDGSNGVVGVNCAHPGGYPRKVNGTPYAPAGPPVGALNQNSDPGLSQKKFATGMNGDEDLGLDMVVKGTPVHILQNHGGLPQCDGSNGVSGVNCVTSGSYPRKLEGTPYAPAGPPVLALGQNPRLTQGKFATGMNGDEDLGLDMTVGGTKVHVLQHPTGLPLCDGSNGVVGVNCAHPGNFPRKVTGTPYAPAGPPVLALAEQLPLCNGSNGVVGLDCLNVRNYPRKLEGTPYAPAGPPVLALNQGLPLCDGSNGVFGVDCVSSQHFPRKYEGTPMAPNGVPVIAVQHHTEHYHGHHHKHHQLHQHHKKHGHKARDDEDENDNMPAGQGDISDQEKQEPELPACNGSNGVPKVDCLKATLDPVCKGNQRPSDGSGISPDSCRILPVCEGQGEHGVDCWKSTALPVGLVHVKHHHKNKISADNFAQRHRRSLIQEDFDHIERASTSEEDDTEQISPVQQSGIRKHSTLAQMRDFEDDEHVEHAANSEDTDTESADSLVQKKQIYDFGDVVERSSHTEEADTEQIAPVQQHLDNQSHRTYGLQQMRRGGVQQQENFVQLPTCDQWITTNCQPVCTRDLTTGCTEERTPEPPKRDRFEGKWTHKPGQTTIQPRVLPRDGVTNNYQH